MKVIEIKCPFCESYNDYNEQRWKEEESRSIEVECHYCNKLFLAYIEEPEEQ